MFTIIIVLSIIVVLELAAIVFILSIRMDQPYKLEHRCTKCGGTGQVPHDAGLLADVELKQCLRCGGMGWVPTYQGQRVLTLVSHSLGTKEGTAYGGIGIQIHNIITRRQHPVAIPPACYDRT